MYDNFLTIGFRIKDYPKHLYLLFSLQKLTNLKRGFFWNIFKNRCCSIFILSPILILFQCQWPVKNFFIGFSLLLYTSLSLNISISFSLFLSLLDIFLFSSFFPFLFLFLFLSFSVFHFILFYFSLSILLSM